LPLQDQIAAVPLIIRTPGPVCLLLFVLAAALLSSCATPDADVDFVEALRGHPEEGAVISGLPQVQVDRGNYGVQALATVLRFWGVEVEPRDLKNEVGRYGAEMEFEERLMVVAQGHGLWSYAWYGGWADLRLRLDAGIPVLVQLQHGAHAGSRRFAVVTGYDNKHRRVLCEEGSGRPTVYSYSQFGRYWEPVRFWSLVVCPPDRPSWELNAAELVTRARFFELKGEHARALRDYAEAMAVQPLNSRICVNAANLYRKMGEPDKAEGLYRRAIDINPKDGQALNNLAFLYAEQGQRLDEAYDLAQRALLIEPTNPVALDTAGHVLFKQHRYPDAASYFEQAYTRARMLGLSRRRDIAIHLMRTYVAMGQTEKVGALLSDLRYADPQFAIPEDLKEWAPAGKESRP
jgi:tetratricopeptide (TPR) repeat protein